MVSIKITSAHAAGAAPSPIHPDSERSKLRQPTQAIPDLFVITLLAVLGLAALRVFAGFGQRASGMSQPSLGSGQHLRPRGSVTAGPGRQAGGRLPPG